MQRDFTIIREAQRATKVQGIGTGAFALGRALVEYASCKTHIDIVMFVHCHLEWLEF